MRNPDEFDAFYKDARARLLLQTYALTGDLSASRAAVRDSFVVAWHHWRKISRMDDPEAWARPHAWAHAQRRHTARLWHRDKGLDPEIRATLDALGKLPVPQRKTLLLTALTSLSLHDMAREVGLPRAEAERELQTATAQFALHRDVATTHIRPLFEPVREHLETVAWPRPTIVRRAGAARRRTHTAVGVVAAVVGVVVSGTLVTDHSGVRPTLPRAHIAGAAPHHSASPSTPTPSADPEALPPDAMLSADQVAAQVPGRRWELTDTSDNTSGDGLVLPCQQERFADAKGVAALVRSFDTSPRHRAPKVSAVQATEVSATMPAAKAAYHSTLAWYAGCRDERVQLLSTRRVDEVGDQAMLLVLRAWDRPVTTMVVGVARTGQLTTTTLSRITTTKPANVHHGVQLLATAVDGLCGLTGSGACSGKPEPEVVDPLEVGEVPGMLSEVDLPPVTGVARPWVGTQPRKALHNYASTRCDSADFTAGPMTNNLTRSFLIPKARLSDQFGLTETVGTLHAKRARAFVDRVRTRMAKCPDKDLGTQVRRVAHVARKDHDLSVWHLTTEITDKVTVGYYMGIIRNGTAVAQVGFVPDRKVGMGAGTFVDLVNRALERLSAMPRPSAGG